MADKPVDLDTMSTEDLQKYAQDRREILKSTETLRDTVKKTYFHEKDVPPSVPLTAESAKHLVAVSEAILLDATIKRAQEEAEKFKTEQEARNQRIKDGHPLPGDVPWEVPREIRPSGPKQETSEQRHPSRPMYTVSRPCATCGKTGYQLPFEPDPGKKVYCNPCYQEVLASQGRGGSRTTVVGDALNQGLREDNERLRAQVETLTAAAGHGGEKMPSGLSKKKQKEWRSQHRGESEEE